MSGGGLPRHPHRPRVHLDQVRVRHDAFLVNRTAGLTELDALLEMAGKRGFLWHMFRIDRYGPEVLAGVFHRPRCADVFVLPGGEHAHAYRLPTGPAIDVFTPERVYWWYGASPVWTLRALLALPEPDDPTPFGTLIPAPDSLGVAGERVPVQIRRR